LFELFWRLLPLLLLLLLLLLLRLLFLSLLFWFLFSQLNTITSLLPPILLSRVASFLWPSAGDLQVSPVWNLDRVRPQDQQ
jgi:hypothetical protein